MKPERTQPSRRMTCPWLCHERPRCAGHLVRTGRARASFSRRHSGRRADRRLEVTALSLGHGVPRWQQAGQRCGSVHAGIRRWHLLRGTQPDDLRITPRLRPARVIHRPMPTEETDCKSRRRLRCSYLIHTLQLPILPRLQDKPERLLLRWLK